MVHEDCNNKKAHKVVLAASSTRFKLDGPCTVCAGAAGEVCVINNHLYTHGGGVEDDSVLQGEGEEGEEAVLTGQE